MKRMILLALCLIGAASILQAKDEFDSPLEKKQVNLPPIQAPQPGESYAPNEKTDYRRISCFYFNHFVVKEIDLCVEPNCEGKDEGAYRLSIQPLSTESSKPSCQMASGAKEMIIPFEGHFVGAKSHYFFFR